ncbi:MULTISPECIES: allantoate amidohydrolase [unclassified Novosphingobium]|uniref:allantoate amidohydrolase n=1 Tax=unclassified Novosphingobium TaxID=2644732 RepID=UPI001493F22E|nr:MULTISPECIES: allantoate amidohydrolase [unclassified Novosphingobium]MBB3357607.1 allantoate deiminase [Novosphingobium sp. BK256]MBB3373729.1 allantoate deiminase [Novosphingobium sp. BK280]MBB3378141.1 allantoate deiminase [Novosphingobium sp. BK258]MBB3420074.1 allantoate deiminase [Novosphingobium sp. BK267]MBB3447604.1 allantoate deiminase [Novosphingobium sp. BK352]
MVSGGGMRAVERCRALGQAPFSDMAGGLYRGWLSPAHRASVAQVAAWMAEAGMTTHVDGAANLIGRYPGTGNGPPLIIGSHIDSVRDGGVYDGPLGVMLGIECVAALHAANRQMPFAIEVIAFGDEEGSRFPAAMLTSKALAGLLDAVPEMADAQGVALAEALGEWRLSPRTLLAARHPGALAYLEAHIEQGPVLEAEGLALGVVTGIAAQLRYEVTVTGQAGHAGTSAMPLRRDALAGSAEMILAIERIARADASDLVATVGRIEAAPGAANVIAGQVRFTIDVRAGEAVRRDRAAAAILAEIATIATQRGLGVSHRLIHDLPPSPCDPALMEQLESALVAAGHPPRRLVSGAGHDAMNLAHLAPTAMLFIRCRDGISHNPAEHVEPADAQGALAVMLGFIDNLGASCA